MRYLKFFSLLFPLFLSLSTQAQDLEQTEIELVKMAQEVLLHDSLTYKIKRNKEFANLLIKTLKQPESYNYNFDSLKTISILRAEDDAFRIFTWHILDRNRRVVKGEQYHYYFGLVQRKYTNPETGKIEYIVIPLVDQQRVYGGIENTILDDNTWLGALYYPLRYHAKIPKYTIKTKAPKLKKERTKTYTKLVDGKKVTYKYNDRRSDSMYVLGKGMVDKLPQKKLAVYLLLGWNGNDDQTNYKIAELMSFDPDDPKRVVFGASLFYFGRSPKQRAVFKYSDNSPFSLNVGFVKLGGKKRKSIVYDHLGKPNFVNHQPKEIWDLGIDGSYDALWFDKKFRGFRWIKNVEVADAPSKEQLKETAANREKILRRQLQEYKRLALYYGDDDLAQKIDGYLSKANLGKQSSKFIKQQEKALTKRQAEIDTKEKERLKAAGINLGKH